MLRKVYLSTSCEPSRARALAREFPKVKLEWKDEESLADMDIEAEELSNIAFDHWALDRELDALASRDFSLRIHHGRESSCQAVEQVLSRAQRLIDRRNQNSEGDAFDRILTVHRGLHELQKPLVLADFAHALDVWQWILRLEPDASRALQLAALFHDIERLHSEPDIRIEAAASDYPAFKSAHAKRGAEIVGDLLRSLDVTDKEIARVSELVAYHEQPRHDPEAELLADADSLSFFSLNSPGFIDYFGREHGRRKVAYTLNRLSHHGLQRLGALRLRDDVAELVSSCEIEAKR